MEITTPTLASGLCEKRHTVPRSGSSQSASGSRYLERMLTISESCRLQGRNAYEYLIAAMTAHFAGLPAPSLLPADSEVPPAP